MSAPTKKLCLKYVIGLVLAMSVTSQGWGMKEVTNNLTDLNLQDERIIVDLQPSGDENRPLTVGMKPQDKITVKKVAELNTNKRARHGVTCMLPLSLDTLVVGFFCGCIQIWDVKTGECFELVKSPDKVLSGENLIESLVLMPNGLLASLSQDSKKTCHIKLWDIAERKQVKSFSYKASSWCGSLIVLRNGNLVINGANNLFPVLLDPKDGVFKKIDCQGRPNVLNETLRLSGLCITETIHNQQIISDFITKDVIAQTNLEQWRLTGGLGYNSPEVTWLSHDKIVWKSASLCGFVVWDIKNKSVFKYEDTNGFIENLTSVSVGSDSHFLVSINSRGVVKFWDIKNKNSFQCIYTIDYTSCKNSYTYHIAACDNVLFVQARSSNANKDIIDVHEILSKQ